MQVLNAEHRMPVAGMVNDIRILAIFGRTKSGRLLMVGVRPDRDRWDHQIVGAREPTPDETALFERWEGERNG